MRIDFPRYSTGSRALLPGSNQRLPGYRHRHAGGIPTKFALRLRTLDPTSSDEGTYPGYRVHVYPGA
eukprot:1095623-Rhodomonas_salina.1